MQADGSKQKVRIKELKHRIDLWTKRAIEIGDTDREKALDCLKQRQADQTQLENATHSLEKHPEMAQRMEDKVRSLEVRVTDLQQQLTELQSRDSVSRAATELNAIEHSPGLNVHDTIDRWEVSIQQREAQADLHNEVGNAHTSLHDEFKVKEEKETLTTELDNLLKTRN